MHSYLVFLFLIEKSYLVRRQNIFVFGYAVEGAGKILNNHPIVLISWFNLSFTGTSWIIINGD